MPGVQEFPIGFLIDRETNVDLLRNEAIAETIVDLIKLQSEHSVTIGVHGDWGAGKSSVLQMVEAAFSDVGEGAGGTFLCIRFNGWEFQGFEDAKIALIEGVVTQLIEKRPFLSKASAEVKKVLEKIDWLKVAKRTGGLAFNVMTGLPSPDQLGTLVSLFQEKLSDPLALATPENAKAAVTELQGMLKAPDQKRTVPEEVREFHKAFGDLIAAAKIKQLVVLVDDLDRCLPETAIQTLEAIRLFVSLPKTAFVIGADEAMIEYSVQRHFKDLPEGDAFSGYPRAYLEKLVQVPFRIPAMGDSETRIYVTLLLLGAIIGEATPEFAALRSHARQIMSQPWKRQGLDDKTTKEALGDKYTAEAARAVALADQISPVLSAGTKGNPRQVKRFINALSLRIRVAQARGFGDAIQPDVLAKIMLAEMFLPESVFQHIAFTAASSNDGTCHEMLLIEQHARTAQPKENDPEKAEDQPENMVLADWKTRSEVMRWAAIDPEIGSASLKPYLFVINDKKNYVGNGPQISPKLLALLEKLTAGEFAASAASQDLIKLDAAEAEILFATMKTRLLSEPNLKMRPPTVTGLLTLATARPEYQLRYVEVLEMLPPEKLGPWAASGHARAVTAGPAKHRLSKLLDSWKSSGSEALKTGLKAMGSPSGGE